MAFGERLQALRRARGLTQEDLAAELKVSRQAVSKWELNTALPDTDKLVPLARALGVSVDELLGNAFENSGSGTPQPEQKKPGWFATHWYWLGLILAAWGCWQLIQRVYFLLLDLGMTSSF